VQDEVRFDGIHCSLAVSRPYEGVVALVYTGVDVGELGDWPFRQLARDLEAGGPLEIWVDARATKGASMEASKGWADFLAAHRDRLHRVNLLGTGLIEVTASFVGRFSGLGRRMRLYRDPAAFDAALACACDPGVR
jgi:hypothetical protein